MVTIKTASEITNLTVKSIRFYEKQGLLKPISRTDSGYRMYSPEDIQILQQIKLYRDLKFSIKEITQLLSASPDEVNQIMARQLALVRTIKQEYQRISRLLEFSYKPHKSPQISSGKTVIIGIDLQNEFLSQGILPSPRFETLIKPLKTLFQEARDKKIPIIYVPDNHTKSAEDIAELEIWGDHCIEGTWGAKIIDELAPQEEDYIIKKSFFNGFVQTKLQKLLDTLDVETIIFTGWRTHVCISQTAIEAFHRGYNVIIAKDGVNTNTQEEHDFAINMLKTNYGFKLQNCETILENIAYPSHNI